jgi:hypothetical protein
MGMHYEWDDASASVNWTHPGHGDAPSGDEGLKKPALVIGGGGGGAIVIEDTKENLIAFAKRVLRHAEAIDWTEITHSIDLGQRTNEEGYIDSIKLIHRVLVGLDTERVEYKAELDQALDFDLAEIDDSGQDLDTMHDLLIEWEERAEESDLYAYADGESGMYWVTNIPEEG